MPDDPASAAGVPVPRGPGVRQHAPGTGRLGQRRTPHGTSCRPPPSRSSTPSAIPSDAPVKVELPDVAAALGAAGIASYLQTLGELDISVLLADGGNGSDSAAAAAEGWGGDRLVSLDGPDGSWAVVWQTAWDSGDDADEFSAAADAAMSDLDGAHAVLPGADIAGGLDAPVLVLVASSARHPAAGRDGAQRRRAEPRRRGSPAVSQLDQGAGGDAGPLHLLGGRDAQQVRGCCAGPVEPCRRAPAAAPR